MPRDETTASRATTTGAGPIDWPAELERHGRWLRTVALARVGDAAAADDVMQEVPMTALEKGHQLRDPTRVAGWLYRLVVVAALQYRRRQGRRKKAARSLCRTRSHRPKAWRANAIRSAGCWPTSERRWCDQALDKLPPRDAEVMLLKYSEDWSYQQMAEHLGMSVSAVEARLHRARQKMRQRCAKSIRV